MRTCLTLSIWFLLVNFSQQTFGQNKAPITADDKVHFWGSLDHYYSKDSMLCADLTIVSTLLRPEELKLYVVWNDSVIDSRKITPNERRWKDPQGKIRDKDLMYFYDGLGIRLFYKDYFYEGWIMPLGKENWQIQWENAGSMATRISNNAQVLKLEYDKDQLSLKISFIELGWSISEAEILKITLIAVDSDTPEIIDMYTRIANGISYCTSTKEFTIN